MGNIIFNGNYGKLFFSIIFYIKLFLLTIAFYLLIISISNRGILNEFIGSILDYYMRYGGNTYGWEFFIKSIVAFFAVSISLLVNPLLNNIILYFLKKKFCNV